MLAEFQPQAARKYRVRLIARETWPVTGQALCYKRFPGLYLCFDNALQLVPQLTLETS